MICTFLSFNNFSYPLAPRDNNVMNISMEGVADARPNESKRFEAGLTHCIYLVIVWLVKYNKFKQNLMEISSSSQFFKLFSIFSFPCILPLITRPCMCGYVLQHQPYNPSLTWIILTDFVNETFIKTSDYSPSYWYHEVLI